MELTTVAAIIDKLGGISEVARLTGRSYDAVWYWRKVNRFPPRFYGTLIDNLRSAGHSASRSLWGME